MCCARAASSKAARTTSWWAARARTRGSSRRRPAGTGERMRSAVDTTLLALLSAQDEPVPPLPARDWDALAREAVRHGVAALVHARLEDNDCGAPQAVRQVLKASHLRTGLENLRLLTRLGSLLRRWQARGIDVIVLKGAHLAQSVYGDPALRPMGDADLLLRRADLDGASALLRESGWHGEPPSALTLPA